MVDKLDEKFGYGSPKGYSSDFDFLKAAVRELNKRLDKFEETLKMLVEKDKARLASEAKKNIHNLRFRG